MARRPSMSGRNLTPGRRRGGKGPVPVAGPAGPGSGLQSQRAVSLGWRGQPPASWLGRPSRHLLAQGRHEGLGSW